MRPVSHRTVLPAPLLRYDDQLIRVDETITHLGITLDRRLTFSNHIEKTTTRCLRTLGTLKGAQRRGIINQQRMFTLYRSLILSRLSDGGEVLAACPTTLEKLDRVQTAALRIIHNRVYPRHVALSPAIHAGHLLSPGTASVPTRPRRHESW